MKFRNLSRLFGKIRSKRANRALPPKHTSRLVLEHLEERTLLSSTLPTPQISNQTILGATPGTNSANWGTSPQAAIDPINPNKIVVADNQSIYFAGTNGSFGYLYTIDGGQNWSRGSIGTTGAQNSDASIAFDRDENFYIVSSQHAADYTSGSIVLYKFDFSSTSPSQVSLNNAVQGEHYNANQFATIYTWGSGADGNGRPRDAAYSPVVAVDNNVTSYTDPVTGKVQTDPLATMFPDTLRPGHLIPKGVFVAYNVNYMQEGTGNPSSSVMVSMSGDGGYAFSTSHQVGTGAHPQIVFTQGAPYDPTTTSVGGTAGTTSLGGQMVYVWNTITGADSAIQVKMVQPDGGLTTTLAAESATPVVDTEVFTGTTGGIADAFDPDTNNPNDAHIPGIRSFTATVNITSANFTTLEDLDVALNVTHPNLKQLQITLTHTDPTLVKGTKTITFLNNAIDAFGKTINPGQGINTGATADLPGVIFDSNAPRNIRTGQQGAGAWVGHFQPEGGSLNGSFYGWTAAQLNGTWTLTVTDTRDDNNPVQSVNSWNLRLVSGVTPTAGNGGTIAGTTNQAVAGWTGGANPTAVQGRPIGDAVGYTGNYFATNSGNNVGGTQGIGLGLSVAIDNTLGSFSPYQGNLYLGYTGQGLGRTGTGVPNADDPDVYLVTIQAGLSPTNANSAVRVNNDVYTDNSTEGDRAQFEPSLAVDPTTGTLVIMWYDARNDAANARVASYISTSIDGGATIGAQTYLNQSKTATDAVTGQSVTIEPIPGNQATLEALGGAGALGFGYHQAVLAYGGRVYPFWTDNQNGIGLSEVNVWTATVTIAGGPRGVVTDSSGNYVSSTGSVTSDGTTPVGGISYNNTYTSDGSRQLDGFVAAFDRYVDPATVTPSDVRLQYQDPNTGAITDLSNQVTSVAALNTEQTIVLTGSVTSYTLSYNGSTAAISGTATATTVLQTLNNITALKGNINVTGPVGGPFVISFTGALTGQNPVLLQVASVTGTGTVKVVTGTLYVSNAVVREGNTGQTTQAVFTLTLSRPQAYPITLQYTTWDVGTAIANTDYTGVTSLAPGSVTIPAGQTSATFSVSVLGNNLATGNKTFYVNVSGLPSNIALGGTADNEQQTLSIDSTVTQLSFSFNGTPATTTVTGPFTKATILNALNTIAALNGKVTISGPDGYLASGSTPRFNGGPFVLTYNGSLAGTDVPKLLVTATGGSATVAENLRGGIKAKATIIDIHGAPSAIIGDASLQLTNTVSVDEVQQVFIPANVTSLTFAYSYDGVHSITAPSALSYVNGTTTAADLQNYLQTIPDLKGNVTVAQPVAGTPAFNITFKNALGGLDIPLLSVTAYDSNSAPVTVTRTETTKGSGNFISFPVYLSTPATSDVSMTWTEVNGSASSADFADRTSGFSGVLNIPAGQTQGTIIIGVRPNTTGNFTFAVTLNNPIGMGLNLIRPKGTGMLVNSGTVGISIGDITVQEGNVTTNAFVPVYLNGVSSQNVTVNYTTSAIPQLSQYASSVLGYSTSVFGQNSAVGGPDGTGANFWSFGTTSTQFITLGFTTPSYASGVLIRELVGNGFVTRVDLLDTGNNFHTVFSGSDPTLAGNNADFRINFPTTTYLVQGVRVYVDTLHDLANTETLDSVALLQAGYTADAAVPIITLNGTTNFNSNLITLASTSGLSVNMAVTGTGIPANSFITAINSTTQITISNQATVTGTNPLTFSGITLNGSTTQFSNLITLASTAGLSVNMAVTGTGIPANSFITAINSATQITISNPATATSVTTLIGNTTAGSALITLPSTAGLSLNRVVTGTGIPANSIITAINSATQITISNPATATSVTNLNGSTILNSNTITLASTTGLIVGMAVTGAGIPANSVITGINAFLNTITINNLAIVTGNNLLTFSGVSLTFTGVPLTFSSSGDYLYTTGTVTIPSGSTMALIPVPVPILATTAASPNRAFQVVLSGANNASILNSAGTVTIVDDDYGAVTNPLPSFTVGNMSFQEGSGANFIPVYMSGVLTSAVTVNYAFADGSAYQGTGKDYSATSGTLTFSPGQQVAYIPVNILADGVGAGNKFFNVNLSSPSDVTLANINAASATITIMQKDPSVTVGAASVLEGRAVTPGTVSFPVYLSAPLGTNLTLNWNLVNGSTSAGDFAGPTSGTVTFLSGSIQASIDIPLVGNATAEDLKTFQVQLSPATGVHLQGLNEVQTININGLSSALDFAFNGVTGGSATLTGTTTNLSTTISGLASTSQFSVGMVVTGTGIPANTIITAINSPTQITISSAATATATGVLLNFAGHLVVSPTYLTGNVTNFSTFISNLSSTSQLSVGMVVSGAGIPANTLITAISSATTITISNAATATANNVPLTFTSPNAVLTSDLLLAYLNTIPQLTGNVAVSGPTKEQQTITIPGTVTSVQFTYNGYTGATLSTVGLTAASLLTNLNSITGLGGLISVSGTGPFVVTFSATLGQASLLTATTMTGSGTVTITETTRGVAAIAPFTVTFINQLAGQNVPLLSLANQAGAANVVIVESVAGGTGAGIGQGMIVNDDSAPVRPTLNINDITFLEGNYGTTKAYFTVLLSQASAQDITVQYTTVDGTATAGGNDYVPATGTLTIKAGELSGTIEVDIPGDSLVESGETFSLQLSNAVGGDIAKDVGQATIVNDDTTYGASLYLIRVLPQSKVGTYSYAIGPYVSDRIGLATPSTNPGPGLGEVITVTSVGDGVSMGSGSTMTLAQTAFGAGQNEVQTLSLTGTVTAFTLNFAGVAGSALGVSSSVPLTAARLLTYLQGFAGFNINGVSTLNGNVTVTGTDGTAANPGGGPFTITFIKALAATSTPVFTATGVTGGGSVGVAETNQGGGIASSRQVINVGGLTTGQVTFSFNGVSSSIPLQLTTTPTATQILGILQDIAALNGNITVQGPDGGPFVVTFINQLAGQNVPAITFTSSGVNTAITQGPFNLSTNGTPNSPGLQTSVDLRNTIPSSQVLRDATVTLSASSTSTRLNMYLQRSETQTLSLTGTPVFYLQYYANFTTYTATQQLTWSSSLTADDVKFALNTITPLIGNVDVTGSNGGPFLVSFVHGLAGQDVQNLSVQTTGIGALTGGSVNVVETVKGAMVMLSNTFFSSGGASYVNVTFDDRASKVLPTTISTALIGTTYQPRNTQGNYLGIFQGQPVNTIWTLEIDDPNAAAGAVTGNLKNWSLKLQTGTSLTVTGNYMDQNQNDLTVDQLRTSQDVFAMPSSTSGAPFQAPYSSSTLPLILPGPQVVTSYSGSSQLPVNIPYASRNALGTGADLSISPITLSGIPNGETIKDLNVTVSLVYPVTTDLILTLIAPDGTRIPLATNRGNTTGVGGGYNNITFDDQATFALSAFTSNVANISFLPETKLSTLYGKNPNGTWQLEVNDSVLNNNTGILQKWSLSLTTEQLALNGSANYVDVLFDRDMDTSSFTSSNVKQIISTAGNGSTSRNALDSVVIGIDQTMTITGTVTGFTFNYGGVASTLPFSGTLAASAIQANLWNGISALNGNVLVNGPTGGPFDITFINALAGQTANLLTTTAVTGGGSINIVLGGNGTTQHQVQSIAIPNPNLQGNFTLTFDSGSGTPQTTSPIAFNATAADIQNALIALNNLGSVTVSGSGTSASPFLVIFTDSFANYSPLSIVSVTPLGVYINTTDGSTPATGIKDGNGSSQHEVQSIVIPNPGAPGSFKLTFDNVPGGGNPQTTSAIPFSATAQDITTALEALGNIYQVSVAGSGTPASPFLITFLDSYLDFDPLANTANGLRQFRIGFPTQLGTGQYSVVFGPDSANNYIQDVQGNKLDINRNAGVDVLKGGDPSSGSIVTTTYPSGTLAASNIAAAAGASTVQFFPITVVDSFTIQSTTLQLNISNANAGSHAYDLRIQLVSPQGQVVTLFDGASLYDPTGPGTQFGTANFSNTIFDDSATSANIANQTAPFASTFSPQFPLSDLNLTNAQGTWNLVVTNAGTACTLSYWNLTFKSAQSGSGLGEPVADQFTRTFRIFTQDPSNSVSSDMWTPIGPSVGDVTAIAADPSDTTGNTVYAGAASGGLWKTTNFLTTDPQGPTWVSLIDNAPVDITTGSNGLNIGCIAIFPQYGDPEKSIIYVGTGNSLGNGVGILRSLDGGKTWIQFTGPAGSSFVNLDIKKIVFDPKLNTSNQRLIYIAVNGTGVWRLTDPDMVNGSTGWTNSANWTNLRAGDASDVSLDPAYKDPITGNLGYLYAGVGGSVYFTPNASTATAGSMAQSTGGQGVSYRRDYSNGTIGAAIPVTTAGIAPSGGSVKVATPALTGKPLYDAFYQDWVYALANQSLYMSKDHGSNWTLIKLPSMNQTINGTARNVVGTNDETRNSLTLYNNATLTVDPSNPNVVYIGSYNQNWTANLVSPLIRVDTTTVADPYAMVGFDNSENDGGTSSGDGLAGGNGSSALSANADVVLKQVGTSYTPYYVGTVQPTYSTPYFNLARDPVKPFAASSQLYLTRVNNFNNDGGDVKWINMYSTTNAGYAPLYSGSAIGNGLYQLLALPDPVTGQTRLYAAGDGGVSTLVVNSDGSPNTTGIGSTGVVNGNRTGNMQLTHVTNSAIQPSTTAAGTASSLVYTQSTSNGSYQSSANILTTGNLDWSRVTFATQGSSNGVVATAPSGTGGVYRFMLNLTGGPAAQFFQVASGGGASTPATGGPINLPAYSGASGTAGWTTAAMYAVNPLLANSLLIASQGAAYIFQTDSSSPGISWNRQIADVNNYFGANSITAMAFGAPAVAPYDNFVYAATNNNRLWVTFTDGGSAAAWKDLNFPGAAQILRIYPNPTKGKTDAYVLTNNSVYYLADATAAAPVWTKLNNVPGKANLVGATGPKISILGGTTTNATVANTGLTSMVVDWRYAVPDDLTNPTGATHPVLYVGANVGVYRSLDKGFTWTYFPNGTSVTLANGDGAQQDLGYLPVIKVTDLDLSVGATASGTGSLDQSTGLNMLLASTDGRGTFGIRLDDSVLVSDSAGHTPKPLADYPAVPSLSAPRVTTQASSQNGIIVNFNAAIDPASFTTDDVILNERQTITGGGSSTLSFAGTPAAAGTISLGSSTASQVEANLATIPAANEVQTLTIPATLNQFQFLWKGNTGATPLIVSGATAASVLTSLTSVPGLTSTNVSVNGSNGSFTINFMGSLASTDVVLLDTTNLNGTGTPTIVETTKGHQGLSLNEQQTITLPAAATSFYFTYNGNTATLPLTVAGATATTVTNALLSVSGLTATNISVAPGTLASTFVVSFTGNLAGVDVTPLGYTNLVGLGPVPISETVKGGRNVSVSSSSTTGGPFLVEFTYFLAGQSQPLLGATNGTVITETIIGGKPGLVDPFGNIVLPTSIVDISGSAHNQFQITLPSGSLPGVYSFAIGPDISNPAGKKMDQNQDGVSGVVGPDTYTGKIFVQPFTNNAPVVDASVIGSNIGTTAPFPSVAFLPAIAANSTGGTGTDLVTAFATLLTNEQYTVTVPSTVTSLTFSYQGTPATSPWNYLTNPTAAGLLAHLRTIPALQDAYGNDNVAVVQTGSSFLITFINQLACQALASPFTIQVNTGSGSPAILETKVGGVTAVSDPDDPEYQIFPYPSNGTALRGIAITGSDNTKGTWQYSTDSGTTWNNFPTSLANNNALLLSISAINRLRFIPNTGFYSTLVASRPTFTFRAWDQTSGLSGGFGNATSNGFTAPYSSAVVTANINVAPLNNAPTFSLNQNTLNITEDAGAQTVSGLVQKKTITTGAAISSMTANTTSASATVSGLSSTSGLNVGMYVFGNGIPAGTSILAIPSGTTLTLSAKATATATGTLLSFTNDASVTSQTGVTTLSNPTITGLASTASLKVGMLVFGPGIPANSVILSIDSATQVTLNTNATASAAGGTTLIFAKPDVGQTVTLQVSSVVVTSTTGSLSFIQAPTLVASGSSNGISTDWDLTFTTSPNTYGTAVVFITAVDSGPSGGGNVNTSAVQAITINVANVNDMPSFTLARGASYATRVIAPNIGAQTITGVVTNISPGPYETESVSFILSNFNAAYFSVAPTINASTGALSFTPSAAALALSPLNITIDVQLKDAGSPNLTTSVQTLYLTLQNTAPHFVTTISDQAILWKTNTAALPFSYTDAETPTALTIAVSATNTSGTLNLQAANLVLSTATYSSTTKITSRKLTIKPTSGEYGTATIDVQVTDNGGLSDIMSFELTVNQPPTLGLTPGPVAAINHGGTLSDITALVTDGDSTDFTYTATVAPETFTFGTDKQSSAWKLRQQYGFMYTGSYNPLGQFAVVNSANPEKWIYSTIQNKWYSIYLNETTPGAEIRLYSGNRLTPLGTLSSGKPVSTPLAKLDRAYYDHPELIHDAQPPDVQSYAYYLDLISADQTKLKTGTPTSGLRPADQGINVGPGVKLNVQEKWFQNDKNLYFYMTPDGVLYQYKGSKATSTVFGILNPDYYANPDLLASAWDPSTPLGSTPAEQAYGLDQVYQLSNLGYSKFNGHQNEKWMYGNYTKTWYYLKPNGDFGVFSGSSTSPLGGKIARLTLDANNDLVNDFWANPSLLHDPSIPSVQIAFDDPTNPTSNNPNNLTVTAGDPTLIGRFQVKVTASDGFASASATTYVTWYNNLPTISPANPPLYSAFDPVRNNPVSGPGPLDLNPNDPNPTDIPHLSFPGPVQVMDLTSLAYDLDKTLGLGAFTASYFNKTGNLEKWTYSSVLKRWYAVLPNGDMYVGSSTPTTNTVLGPLVASFNDNPGGGLSSFYANPIVSLTGANTTFGSTTISWSTSTTGLSVGMRVTGTGIPANATIKTINSNGLSITLSSAATATNSGVSLVFSKDSTKLTNAYISGTTAPTPVGSATVIADTLMLDLGTPSGTYWVYLNVWDGVSIVKKSFTFTF